MEEQIATTPEKKKTDFSAFLQPKKLVLYALIALALAALIGFIPALISVLGAGGDSQYAIHMLTNSVSGIIQNLLNGLILPVCLFLMIGNTGKVKLSKIFFIVSVVFILAQLVSALVLVIGSFSANGSGILGTLLQWIPGGGLLASPVNTIKTIFEIRAGFIKELSMLVSSILRSLSDVFYILPNIICAFAFFKLSSAKTRRKPAVAEEE